MDLTVCVMLPPRGDTTFERSAHSKIPVLAPVCIYPLQEIKEVTAPRTGYIHVTGCPEQVTPERISRRLCQGWEEWVADRDIVTVVWTDGKQKIQTIVDPKDAENPAPPSDDRRWDVVSKVPGVEPVTTYRGKRMWVGIVASLSLRQKAELLQDRQTSMTWTAFRDAFIRQDTLETLRQELIARALG
jgi:hypothetical protein